MLRNSNPERMKSRQIQLAIVGSDKKDIIDVTEPANSILTPPLQNLPIKYFGKHS